MAGGALDWSGQAWRVKVNGPFRHEAAGWSPLESAVDDEPAVRSRRGPSLLFAVTVIAGVALVTAGAVAMFAIEPSEGAPEQKATVAPETVAADKSAVTASLEPSIPVHKVTTLPVPAARAPADPLNKPQTAVSETVDTEDLDALQALKDASQEMDALQQQDPRWARSDSEKSATAFDSVLQPAAASGDNAAAGTDALALADPSPTDVKKTVEGAETAAIAPEDLKPKQTAKVKPAKPAEAKADDDNLDLPPGVSSSSRTVQITKGANMRSRPKSGASVLSVVPKGASVQLVSCSAWCEIIYDGRRGYVYKDFIGGAGRGGSAAKSTKTKTVFTVDAKQPETTTTTSSTQPKSTFKPVSSRLQ
jgi:hypothetical protein